MLIVASIVYCAGMTFAVVQRHLQLIKGGVMAEARTVQQEIAPG